MKKKRKIEIAFLEAACLTMRPYPGFVASSSALCSSSLMVRVLLADLGLAPALASASSSLSLLE
jgi:hypothetical protein